MAAKTMDDLRDKVRMALDEARILVLGIQVLIGFEYEAAFQKTFPNLPELSQNLKIVSLLFLLVALGFIMAPAAFHQIVEGGADNPRCLSFITTIMGLALLPFALGLGGDIYVAVQKVAGIGPGIAAGAISVLVAVVLWYGIELLQRSRHTKEDDTGEQDKKKSGEKGMEEKNQATPLKDKIQFALTETRVVLPGAQALLGFQVVIMLTEAFDKLPEYMKYLHLASLFTVALSMMMLMAPAAFHRLAEHGQSTERLHKFASRMIVGAMFLIALGIAGDLYMVVAVVTKSDLFALVCSIVALCFFYGLWFGYPLLQRGSKEEKEARTP